MELEPGGLSYLADYMNLVTEEGVWFEARGKEGKLWKYSGAENYQDGQYVSVDEAFELLDTKIPELLRKATEAAVFCIKVKATYIEQMEAGRETVRYEP